MDLYDAYMAGYEDGMTKVAAEDDGISIPGVIAGAAAAGALGYAGRKGFNAFKAIKANGAYNAAKRGGFMGNAKDPYVRRKFQEALANDVASDIYTPAAQRSATIGKNVIKQKARQAAAERAFVDATLGGNYDSMALVPKTVRRSNKKGLINVSDAPRGMSGDQWLM